MERRSLLRAAAVLTAATTTGCAVDDITGSRDTVRVAVAWSGAELEAFRAVLAELPALPGFGPMTYTVEPVSLGDDIEAALATRGIGRPDIVLLPRAGLIRSSRAELEPLPPEAWEPSSYAKVWHDLLIDPESRLPYGLPFKAAHKSLVWYHKKKISDPEHLRDLSRWRDISLGAADGWVLTDFFENILYGHSRGTYDELVTTGERRWDNPAIRTAFDLLGRVWGAEGAIAGGVERSLGLQFPDAVEEVFRFERATLVVAPDFAQPIVAAAFDSPEEYAENVGVTQFPALSPGTPPPLVAGGEFAVLTRPASKSALDLVRRLAHPRAPVPWVSARGGFIPANRRTPVEFPPYLDELFAQLREDHGFAFDLSDQLGGAGGRDGLWRVLTHFLQEVGDGRIDRVEEAVDRAIERMDDLEHQARSLSGGAAS